MRLETIKRACISNSVANFLGIHLVIVHSMIKDIIFSAFLPVQGNRNSRPINYRLDREPGVCLPSNRRVALLTLIITSVRNRVKHLGGSFYLKFSGVYN